MKKVSLNKFFKKIITKIVVIIPLICIKNLWVNSKLHICDLIGIRNENCVNLLKFIKYKQNSKNIAKTRLNPFELTEIWEKSGKIQILFAIINNLKLYSPRSLSTKANKVAKIIPSLSISL